jgi:endonuclease/exonuclease/phosphatase (EEP) superfamily protein YafD
MRGLLKAAAILLGLAGAALTVPLVLGFLGRLHPLFVSLSHFRLHLAVAIAAAGLLLLATPGWRRNGALMIALALAASVATLWPALRNSGTTELPRPTYRLLQMNLRFDNPRPELVLDLLEREKPDIVTLEEVSKTWIAALSATQAAYPHRIICPPQSYIGGVAILSRLPFAEPQPRCTRGGSLAVATVDFDGRPAEVAALHLVWPWPFGQDRQVVRLAPLLAELGPRVVLGGDFNATPWSGTVRTLAAAGGMELAPWVGPSYLDRRLPDWLRPLAGLPIDHVLVKGDIVAGRTTRLDAAGSDHLPVLFEFAIAEPPPAVRVAGQ